MVLWATDSIHQNVALDSNDSQRVFVAQSLAVTIQLVLLPESKVSS